MEKQNPMVLHSAKQLHDWLEKNHSTCHELHIQFFNAKSGKAGLRYRDALDEALCFGWIDGVRRNSDAERYVIHFAPTNEWKSEAGRVGVM